MIFCKNMFLATMILIGTVGFSQNTTDSIPNTPLPPLPPIAGDSWHSISTEDKKMFFEIKNKIESSESSMDSVLHELIKYLSEIEKLTNFRVKEAAQLINKIPGERSLIFLINNIDLKLSDGMDGSIHQQWRSYPIYAVIIEDSEPNNRCAEIADIIFNSNILKDCKITGKKLSLLKAILKKHYGYDSILANAIIKTHIEYEENLCKVQNLSFILNENYQNKNYSRSFRF